MTDSIIDILRDDVALVSAALMPQFNDLNRGIQQISYLHGPIKEINNKLTAATKDPSQKVLKYPLVILFQPFEEGRGTDNGVDTTDNIRIIIVTETLPEIFTEERYAVNFVPILRPIYDELLNQLALDERVMAANVSLIQHTKVEWPFWDDGNDKNPFNDRLDIIEIKGLKLKIYTNC